MRERRGYIMKTKSGVLVVVISIMIIKYRRNQREPSDIE